MPKSKAIPPYLCPAFVPCSESPWKVLSLLDPADKTAGLPQLMLLVATGVGVGTPFSQMTYSTDSSCQMHLWNPRLMSKARTLQKGKTEELLIVMVLMTSEEGALDQGKTWILEWEPGSCDGQQGRAWWDGFSSYRIVLLLMSQFTHTQQNQESTQRDQIPDPCVVRGGGYPSTQHPQMGLKKEGGNQDRIQHPRYQEDNWETAPAISSYDQAHGLGKPQDILKKKSGWSLPHSLCRFIQGCQHPTEEPVPYLP